MGVGAKFVDQEILAEASHACEEIQKASLTPK